MDGGTDDDSEPIDRKTSWWLQENFGLEPSQPSFNLERLMDELRRRDEANRSP